MEHKNWIATYKVHIRQKLQRYDGHMLFYIF